MSKQTTTAYLPDGTAVEVTLPPPERITEGRTARRGNGEVGYFTKTHPLDNKDADYIYGTYEERWWFVPVQYDGSLGFATHTQEKRWITLIHQWDVTLPTPPEPKPLKASAMINVDGKLADSELVEFADIPVGHVFTLKSWCTPGKTPLWLKMGELGQSTGTPVTAVSIYLTASDGTAKDPDHEYWLSRDPVGTDGSSWERGNKTLIDLGPLYPAVNNQSSR